VAFYRLFEKELKILNSFACKIMYLSKTALVCSDIIFFRDYFSLFSSTKLVVCFVVSVLHAQQPRLEDPGGEPGRVGGHQRRDAAAHDDSGGAGAPAGGVPAGQVNASAPVFCTREQNTDGPPPFKKRLRDLYKRNM